MWTDNFVLFSRTPKQFYSLSISTQLEFLATEHPTPRAIQELAKGVFEDTYSFVKDMRKVQISANI
jgi:hypothetical protein